MRLRKIITASSLIFIGSAVHAGDVYVCVSCDPGTYSSNGHETDACTNCPTGYYQDKMGQSSCKVCGAGQYQDSIGQTSCKTCDGLSGQYQNEQGQASCKTCPDYPTKVAACNNQTGGATSCQAGYYLTGTTCTLCPAGSYCPGGTAKYICPKGSYCPSGSASNILCPVGHYCPNDGMSDYGPACGTTNSYWKDWSSCKYVFCIGGEREYYTNNSPECGSVNYKTTSYCQSKGSINQTDNPAQTDSGTTNLGGCPGVDCECGGGGGYCTDSGECASYSCNSCGGGGSGSCTKICPPEKTLNSSTCECVSSYDPHDDCVRACQNTQYESECLKSC